MLKLRLLLLLGLFWLVVACSPADPTRPPTRTPTQPVVRPSVAATTIEQTPATETPDSGGSKKSTALPTLATLASLTPTPTADPLACLPEDPGETGLVSWVIDGETFVIDQAGKRQTVRLLGVDAPPLAAETTRNLLDRRVVRLVADVRNADPSGRLLRYVLLLDGRFVNDELLRSGVARLDPDVRGLACMAQFADAEKYAIQEGLGLWAMAAVAGLPTELQPTQPPTQLATPTGLAGTAQVTPTNSRTVSPTVTFQISQPPNTPVIPPQTGGTPAQPPTLTPTATRPAATGTSGPTGAQIVNIFYDGVKGVSEPDEYIEIKNFGATPLNLSFWLINAEAYDLWYMFPDGTFLQPGQSCRVYSNEVNSDSCADDSFLDPLDDWQVWYNRADCGYLYDYTEPDPVSTKCYGQ